MLDLAEASSRWQRVQRLMLEHDLDCLVAIDLSRDEVLLGHQRWLTGYIPIGGPAAALIHRDGSVELISERIGKPVSDHYKANEFPIETVGGFSSALLAERLIRRNPGRIGIAEAETFPAALAALLADQVSPPELVDMSSGMQRLRLRKSAYEIGVIRQSCAIADAVWDEIPGIFRLGRHNYEIMADVDHLVRLAGAEGGFHLLLPLPFLGRPIRALANPERIGADARFLLEISPRYQGYYSQLTIPVTSRPDDQEALRAYEDVVEAKRSFQPRMRPGADLSQIARSIDAFLTERGHSMSSLSLGHFCGMALEEPRHDPSAPFILETGMTLIFHPVLGDAGFKSLMRADTYLITESGAENLNRFKGGMLAIS